MMEFVLNPIFLTGPVEIVFKAIVFVPIGAMVLVEHMPRHQIPEMLSAYFYGVTVMAFVRDTNLSPSDMLALFIGIGCLAIALRFLFCKFRCRSCRAYRRIFHCETYEVVRRAQIPLPDELQQQIKQYLIRDVHVVNPYLEFVRDPGGYIHNI